MTEQLTIDGVKYDVGEMLTPGQALDALIGGEKVATSFCKCSIWEPLMAGNGVIVDSAGEEVFTNLCALMLAERNSRYFRRLTKSKPEPHHSCAGIGEAGEEGGGVG